MAKTVAAKVKNTAPGAAKLLKTTTPKAPQFKNGLKGYLQASKLV